MNVDGMSTKKQFAVIVKRVTDVIQVICLADMEVLIISQSHNGIISIISAESITEKADLI